MSVAHSSRDYIPAAGRHWSLPLYDPLTKIMGVDRLRTAFLQQARLQPSHTVLDMGCGTGTFAVLIKRVSPHVNVIGLDPDPDALDRARGKAERAGYSIQFDRGMAGDLPYPDGAFDRVFSTFVFHHLVGDQKTKMLREVRRVLAPGGTFHLIDFAGPDAPRGLLARFVHSHRLLRDNSEHRIVGLMNDAGLRGARRLDHHRLLLGTAVSYDASRED
jgi:ubiquinone/menaquinone biosynthesis C-methylase UbiE